MGKEQVEGRGGNPVEPPFRAQARGKGGLAERHSPGRPAPNTGEATPFRTEGSKQEVRL